MNILIIIIIHIHNNKNKFLGEIIFYINFKFEQLYKY